MIICHTISQLRACLNQQAHAKRGFVPTMGNLHAGHLALIAKAKAHSDCVVASIFVNRLQFLPHEDFDAYPRTWEDDIAALQTAGCDVLFAPDETELYPQPQTFKVHPAPDLANQLEGEFRPGFFVGVCTVVMKLFQIVQPDVAVFGKKDYQQLAVIRQMVEQFAMPIEIIAEPTQRASDGLALSSRNRYLSHAERLVAPALFLALQQLADAAQQAGAELQNAELQKIEAQAVDALRHQGWQVDYLTLRTQKNLQPVNLIQREPWVALGAARLGKTRLIDNFEIF